MNIILCGKKIRELGTNGIKKISLAYCTIIKPIIPSDDCESITLIGCAGIDGNPVTIDAEILKDLTLIDTRIIYTGDKCKYPINLQIQSRKVKLPDADTYGRIIIVSDNKVTKIRARHPITADTVCITGNQRVIVCKLTCRILHANTVNASPIILQEVNAETVRITNASDIVGNLSVSRYAHFVGCKFGTGLELTSGTGIISAKLSVTIAIISWDANVRWFSLVKSRAEIERLSAKNIILEKSEIVGTEKIAGPVVIKTAGKK